LLRLLLLKQIRARGVGLEALWESLLLKPVQLLLELDLPLQFLLRLLQACEALALRTGESLQLAAKGLNLFARLFESSGRLTSRFGIVFGYDAELLKELALLALLFNLGVELL
jgi:hypothetical protein